MSYIDDELAVLPQWEGCCTWPYLDSDTPANVTTGIGYLIPTLDAMLVLPWKNPDGSEASPTQIQAEWTRVKSLPGGMVAKAYESPAGLSLTPADVNSITEIKLMQFDADLRKDFPGYDGFPDSIKTRLLDMEWNLGDAKLRGSYPRFDAAVDDKDWPLAAQECGRDTSNPSFAARNKWTEAGFLTPQGSSSAA